MLGEDEACWGERNGLISLSRPTFRLDHCCSFEQAVCLRMMRGVALIS